MRSLPRTSDGKIDWFELEELTAARYQRLGPLEVKTWVPVALLGPFLITAGLVGFFIDEISALSSCLGIAAGLLLGAGVLWSILGDS